MLFNVLEKYAKLKNDLEEKQKEETTTIEGYDKELIKNFLDLYDKDVKQIHSNEEKIEKNLQSLNQQTQELQNLTNEAIQSYDNLIEYFKQTGDLFNWCTILEKQMGDVQETFIKLTSSDQKNNPIETQLDK